MATPPNAPPIARPTLLKRQSRRGAQTPAGPAHEGLIRMHHHSNAAVTRLQPDQPLVAAGYIRVSRQVQAEGHSPDIQREAIKRLARQEGFLLPEDMIQEDHESGGKVSRKG